MLLMLLKYNHCQKTYMLHLKLVIR